MSGTRTEASYRDALAATKAQLELVIREANVGLWDWDVASDTSYLSEGWKRQLGYTDDEISNSHDEWLKRLHPDDKDRVLRETEASLENEEATYRIEFRLRHKDGTYRWIRSCGAVFRDASGKPYRKVGCHIDITDEKQSELHAREQEVECKRVESRLYEQERQLAHVSRISSMGEMVGGIAHEVQQPLQAIASYASACEHSLMSADAPDLDEILWFIKQVEEQSVRCGDIVRKLRSYGMKSKSDFETVDINSLLQDSARLTKLHRDDSNIRFQLDKRLPNIRADRVELQQVFVNILNNAIDALEDTPSKVEPIEILTSTTDSDIRIEVTDHGCGIDPKLADNIFEAFSTTKQEGMGLGLAISQRIVNAHGGTINASSQSGEGTVIHIRLPIS